MTAEAPRPDPSPVIEDTFAAIAAGAMRDVPILNLALRVEAVGFREWDSYWLGVLVTPWTMALMLVPKRLAAAPPPGLARSYRFPSGSYDFLGGFQAALGGYWTCSLFSPPVEFADQDAARGVELAYCALHAVADGDEHPRVAACAPIPGVGLAWVATARGLLLHQLRLERDRIADYVIVAPTEWNFHPQGAFHAELVGLAVTDPDTLEHRARCLALALDPCVDYTLRVVPNGKIS